MRCVTDEIESDEFDSEIPISEALRKELTKRLTGCQHVKIEVEGPPGKWSKIHKIDVGRTRGGAYPVNDEDVIVAVAEAIHQHWIANSDGDIPINYRCNHECLDRNGKRTRPSFQFLYSGLDGDDISGAEDDEDLSLSAVLRQSFTLLSQMAARLDEAHVHIREISGQQKELFAPMQQVMEQSWAAYAAAMDMNSRALFVISDVRKADEEQAAKDRRWGKFFDTFGPLVPAIAPQVGSWLGSKLSGPAPATHAKPPPRAPSPETPDEEDVPQMDEENPIACYANALATTIRPDQWSAISEALTKREFQALMKVFNASTDGGVAEAWDAIVAGAIATGKLITLNSILDTDQQQGYAMLAGAIAQHKKEAKGTD